MGSRTGFILLLAVLMLSPPSLGASDHYYESLSYTIETNPTTTTYACSLHFVSLIKDLSQLEIIIPYPRAEISSDPVVIVGKTVIDPITTSDAEVTILGISFDPMKVGQMETMDLRFRIGRGTEIGPGAVVEVRTLGLAGNVTYHSLGLKLPPGFAVSRVETPQGSVRPGGGEGVPLQLGTEPVILEFVLRRRTILDNAYFMLGLVVAIIAAAIGVPLYVRYRRLSKATKGQ